MRNFLINAAATALMVCIATVASVTGAALYALFTQTPPDSLTDPGAMMFGGIAGSAMAALAGMVFCIVTLFWAALTMPPTLWLIRKFDLPRPAMDVIGGGVMGLVCATMGVGGLSQDKFANMFTPEISQIFAIVGLLTGCLLGFVRHALLVRGRATLPDQGLARAV